MLNGIEKQLSAEFEDMYMSRYINIPDNNLIFAVLERAVLDLFIAEEDEDNQKHKMQAVRWFLSEDRVLPDGFSFLQIVHCLDISDRTVNKLLTLAKSIQLRKGKYYELYSRYRSGYNRSLRRIN